VAGITSLSHGAWYRSQFYTWLYDIVKTTVTGPGMVAHAGGIDRRIIVQGQPEKHVTPYLKKIFEI
jgi:hypothetical protein